MPYGVCEMVVVFWPAGAASAESVSRERRPDRLPRSAAAVRNAASAKWGFADGVDRRRRRINLGADLGGGIVELFLEQIDRYADGRETFQQFHVRAHPIQEHGRESVRCGSRIGVRCID